MPCYHPLVGTRTESGTLKVRARRFDNELYDIQVGCGKCLGCLARVSRDNMIRIMHEKQTAGKSCFLTLTYDQVHLPPGGTLMLTHLQKFVKRLRKRMGKFRYFAIGEYGTERFRPHYHLIGFHQDFRRDRYFWRTSAKGYPLDRSPTLEGLWTFGSSEIGNVSLGSASYIARYVQQKRLTAEIAHSSGRMPEFTTASRRPGLGRDWIEKFYTDVWPRDEVIIDGKKFNPPRYYDKVLAIRDPELYEEIKVIREKRGKEMAADNTMARLRSKEVVAKSQLKHNNQRY